jgi:hypothetical protein
MATYAETTYAEMRQWFAVVNAMDVLDDLLCPRPECDRTIHQVDGVLRCEAGHRRG